MVFSRLIEISLTLRLKKSVLEELAFVRCNFLAFAMPDFLDIVDCATVDKFSIFQLILLLPTLSKLQFLALVIEYFLSTNLPIVQNITLSGNAILLWFLINLL